MDWFYEQSAHMHPVTEEELRVMSIKKYDSGRDIHVGDMIFHGMLVEVIDGEKQYTMIKFHQDEINTIYKTVDNPVMPDSNFPTMKKIRKD